MDKGVPKPCQTGVRFEAIVAHLARALRIAPEPLLAEEAVYLSAAEHGAFVEHTREALPLRVASFKDRPTEVV